MFLFLCLALLSECAALYFVCWFHARCVSCLQSPFCCRCCCLVTAILQQLCTLLIACVLLPPPAPPRLPIPASHHPSHSTAKSSLTWFYAHCVSCLPRCSCLAAAVYHCIHSSTTAYTTHPLCLTPPPPPSPPPLSFSFPSPIPFHRRRKNRIL